MVDIPSPRYEWHSHHPSLRWCWCCWWWWRKASCGWGWGWYMLVVVNWWWFLPLPPTDNHTVVMAGSAQRGCQVERSYRSWLYGHIRMDLEMNCHGRSAYCTLTLYQTLTTSLWLIQWKNILSVNCFPWSDVGISTNTTNLLVVLFRSNTNITVNRMIQLPVAIEFMFQWIIHTSHNRYRLEVLRFLSSKHKMSQYRFPGSLSQSFILHSTSLWLTQMQ